jgi:hypothetical protein
MEGVLSEFCFDSEKISHRRAEPVEQLKSVREEKLSRLGRSRPSRNQSLLELQEGLVTTPLNSICHTDESGRLNPQVSGKAFFKILISFFAGFQEE